MLAREAQLATIDRALVGQALDDGLEVSQSQVTAVNSMMVFGGMYFSTKSGPEFETVFGSIIRSDPPVGCPRRNRQDGSHGDEQGHRPRCNSRQPV